MKNFLLVPAMFVLNQASARICFSPKTDYTIGDQPYSVVSADFNSDGKPDLGFLFRSDPSSASFFRYLYFKNQ